MTMVQGTSNRTQDDIGNCSAPVLLEHTGSSWPHGTVGRHSAHVTNGNCRV